MERFKPLGARDLFGILLPGVILVLISAYALSGIVVLLQLPIGDLLAQEFLLTAILFVVAYLVGSILRLVAADDVDKKSSQYLLQAWRKKHEAALPGYPAEFEKEKAELAKGNDVTADISSGFDDWLWRSDDFPYVAWQTRLWRSHGFGDILNFFQENYKASMWSEHSTSKVFFNHCKLVVIDSERVLADEVNRAEGLTRFLAGTVTAAHLSIRFLWIVFTLALVMVALASASRLGIISSLLLDWKFPIFYVVFSLFLILVLQWIRHSIIRRFRHVRQKEAEVVYEAFYLCEKRRAEERAKKEQAI